MRNVLLFCLLVVSSAAGQDDLDGADDNLLKVIWKRLALQWKEKYQEAELKNAGLSQKIAELETKIQGCSSSDANDDDNAERLRGVEVVKDSSTRANTKPDHLEGKDFRVVVIGNENTANEMVSIRIISAQEDEVIVTMTTSAKKSIYMVPPMGYVQMPLQPIAAQENSNSNSNLGGSCNEFNGMHIVASDPVTVQLLTGTGEAAEEFELPPVSSDGTSPDVLLVANSDITDMLIRDEDGQELHTAELPKGQHVLVPRRSTLQRRNLSKDDRQTEGFRKFLLRMAGGRNNGMGKPYFPQTKENNDSKVSDKRAMDRTNSVICI